MHERVSSPEARAPARCATRPPPVASVAATALRLQAVAGNRAVATLLRRSPARVLMRALMVPDFATEHSTAITLPDLQETYVAYSHVDAEKQPAYWLDGWLQRVPAVRQELAARLASIADNKRRLDVVRGRDQRVPIDDELVAQVQALRDRLPSSAGVMAQIDVFEARSGRGAFAHIDRGIVAAQLREIVARPALIDQKAYPICGADTFVRALAVARPELYVRLVVDLYEHGSARIGGLVVVPKRDVLAKDPRAKGRDMREADWIGSAGVRSSANAYYAIRRADKPIYKFPQLIHSLRGGGTSVSELGAWFTAAGFPVIAQSERPFRDMARHAETLNRLRGPQRVVAVALDAQTITAPTQRGLGILIHPHLVLLASDVRPEKRGAIAGHGCDVLTWGQEKRAWFRDGEHALLGWVAADLSGPPPPEQAPAPDVRASASEEQAASSSSSSASAGVLEVPEPVAFPAWKPEEEPQGSKPV